MKTFLTVREKHILASFVISFLLDLYSIYDLILFKRNEA